MKSIEVVPVLWAYCGWVAVSIVAFALGAAAGRRVRSSPPADPFAPKHDTVLKQMSANWFGWRSFAYLLLVNAIGGVLIYFATRENALAFILFGLLAAWAIYDVAILPLFAREAIPEFIGGLYWVYAAAAALMWVYCLACLVQRWWEIGGRALLGPGH